MTVIAYSSKHQILAADSRCSNSTGDMHLTNCQKVFVLRNGALLGSAGDADARELFELIKNATPRKLPSRHALAELKAEIECLIVFPKGQVYLITSEFVERGAGKHGAWDGEVLPMRDPLVSIGSGSPYAYGAMEHGASPVQAVRAACRRDLMCALPVQWEKL
jgi:ATP-dependent protease HslVU (ClpYQ) peptidase subunit